MSIERGSLLYTTRRYDLAEQEFRAALGQDPNNSLGHAMLAYCLLQQEKRIDATEEAKEAIRLRPDWHLGYAALAQIMLERERPKEAMTAITQALSLDPFNPHYHAMQGSVHLVQSKWSAALQAANRGLEIDPDAADCLNVRARAQTMLGNSDAAAATIQGALGKNPENAHTHANLGWSRLHAGDHRQALVHFREALRLDPDMEWAKAGLVESLKARNILYRWMLRYFLWMARLDKRVQWGIIIAGYFGYQAIRSISNQNPTAALILRPVMVAYVIFAVLTWISQPLFNLVLRLDPFGKYALSKDQRRGAECVGLLLVIPLAAMGLWLKTGGIEWALMAIFCLPLITTSSAIFRCAKGWPRWTMAGFFGCVMGLYLALILNNLDVATMRLGPGYTQGELFNAYLIAAIASSWIANALMQVRIKK